MVSHPIRSSSIVAVMAGLLAVSVAAPGPIGGSQVASAAEPAVFVLPSESDLARDAAIAVDDSPPMPAPMVDPNGVLEEMAVTLDGLPVASWRVEAVAGALGADPDAAFRLVRDAIRFDPYPGVLRGAQGALSARAGNSFDRASLLKGLLDAQGFHTRFAVASLDAVQAGAVLAHACDAPITALPASPTTGLRPAQAAAIATRAQRDYALLRTALGDAVLQMSADASDQALADIARHAWVQLERDGEWVDYDPTLPDAMPGENLVAAVETFDEFPPADRQSVRIRVVAETLAADGGISDTVTLEQILDAADAAERAILLYFQPDPEGAGGGMLGGVGGMSTVVGVISVGDTKTVGAAFPIGDANAGDGLGGIGAGTATTSLLSLRVEFTSLSGGALETTADRILIDRVPADVRASGVISVPQLLPVPTIGVTPALLANVHHVVLSTGGSDPVIQTYRTGDSTLFASTQLGFYKAREKFGLGTILSPLTAVDHGLVLASERVVVPGLEDAGVRAIIDRPRVYLMALGPDAVDPSQIAFQVDLALDGVRLLAAPGTDATGLALRQVWYGALQTALETELIRRAGASIVPDGRRVGGASFDMVEPLSVLVGSEAAESDLSLPALLREALEQDRLVVVSGDAAAAVSWWTVDPVDGTTRSIIASGGRQAWLHGAIISPGGYVVTNPTVGVHWSVYAEADGPRGGLEHQLVTNLVGIQSIAVTEQVATLYITYMRLIALWLVL